MFKFVLLLVVPFIVTGQPGSSVNRAIETLYSQIDVTDDNRVLLAEFLGYFLGFDIDENDELSHNEFFRALHHASFGFLGHEGQLYSLFDQNGDTNITRSDIEDSFRAGDRNNDTHLTETEFSQFIHSGITVVG